ncbi:tautomerase family protein [Streptomyces sp. NPDC098781]|uniref:tautomerase family protein n=1 Tax=Streptomyces sp. NPDC098781 TaxID=3366097 RepID=UPI003804804B
MPFVRIDALRADEKRLEAVGRAVHEALIDTIGIPKNDLLQVLTSHDGTRSKLHYDDYLGIHRDDDVVFVAITMRSGRTDDQKRAIYGRIVDLAKEYAGLDPRNVLVMIYENASIDWSFGEGVAQYVQAGE